MSADRVIQHSIAARLGSLASTAPGAEASATAQVAWLERKAQVFRVMAQVDPGLAREAAEHAALARAAARDLQVETSRSAEDAAESEAAGSVGTTATEADEAADAATEGAAPPDLSSNWLRGPVLVAVGAADVDEMWWEA